MSEAVKPVRLADSIAERIEAMILEGVLRPGEKLAAERDLAEKLGVSRPSLREALARLEDKGLLVTGRGGTTVARFEAALANPLAALFAGNERVTADYFEYRRHTEAVAARLAALRATEIDRAAIAACADRINRAHELDDPAEEAAADAELHVLIYEAAHNVVMLHVMRVFQEMLRQGVFYNRDTLYRRPGVRDELARQHLAIAAAVVAGDPDAAARAADAHIQFTFETSEEIRRDEMRRAAALRRIERSDLLAE